MSRLVFINILRFLVLVFIQVLVFNHMHFHGFLNPYVYILFIILLPFETPGWLLLFLAFGTGLTIDIFSGTLGLHTSATLFAAFIRPSIIRLVGEKPEYDITTQPTLREMGAKWFIAYSALILLMHHLFLNLVDVFSFRELFKTLLRAVFSSAFSFVFILALEYIFTSYKSRE